MFSMHKQGQMADRIVHLIKLLLQVLMSTPTGSLACTLFLIWLLFPIDTKTSAVGSQQAASASISIAQLLHSATKTC